MEVGPGGPPGHSAFRPAHTLEPFLKNLICPVFHPPGHFAFRPAPAFGTFLTPPSSPESHLRAHPPPHASPSTSELHPKRRLEPSIPLDAREQPARPCGTRSPFRRTFRPVQRGQGHCGREPRPQSGTCARAVRVRRSEPSRWPPWSALRAKPAHQIDDKADQQNQADTAAAERWPSVVKTAAAEQEEQHK